MSINKMGDAKQTGAAAARPPVHRSISRGDNSRKFLAVVYLLFCMNCTNLESMELGSLLVRWSVGL